MDNFGNEQIPSLMEWETPEVHHLNISNNWRIATIAILLGFAVFTTIFQRSLLSGFTFVTMALVASILFSREPGKIKCRIHPHGVSINNRFYEYHNLDSFWINYSPGGIKEISIQNKKRLSSYIKIPLADQDPVEIRAQLINYIPEKYHQDTLADVLSRKLGL